MVAATGGLVLTTVATGAFFAGLAAALATLLVAVFVVPLTAPVLCAGPTVPMVTGVLPLAPAPALPGEDVLD